MIPEIVKIKHKPILYSAIKVKGLPSSLTWSHGAAPVGAITLVATAVEQAPSPNAGTVRTFSTPVTGAVEVSYGQIGPFPWGRAQSITARFTDSLGNLSAPTAAVITTPEVGESLPSIVRHQLCQLVNSNPISIDGKNLLILQDDYKEPLIIDGFPPINSGNTIILEIGLSQTTRDNNIAGNTYETVIEVETNLYAFDKQMTNAETRLNNFFSQLKSTINNIPNIGLSKLGAKRIEWTLIGDSISAVEKDALMAYVLQGRLAVYFERIQR